jgi:hypothetical protein
MLDKSREIFGVACMDLKTLSPSDPEPLGRSVFLVPASTTNVS